MAPNTRNYPKGKDVSCQAKMTGNLALAVSATNLITFDAEDWDTHAMHDNAVNPSRFTVPMAGKYFFYCSLSVATPGGSSATRALYVRKNGATTLYGCTCYLVGGQTGELKMAVEVDLAAGDYVEFLVATSALDVIQQSWGGYGETAFAGIRKIDKAG